MSGFLAPYREDGTGPVREWTGNHTMECANSARGGARVDTGCQPSCYCPCHEGWKSRAERGEKSAAEVEARAQFRNAYTAELERARSKGYTEEHDHEHGPQHLLDWATEYLYRGEPVKAAGLIAAARALLACDVVEHGHSVPSVPVVDPEALAAALDGVALSIPYYGQATHALPLAPRREIAESLLASGVVQDRATVEREAAAKALEAFADRHLLHGGQSWRTAHFEAIEYREGRR